MKNKNKEINIKINSVDVIRNNLSIKIQEK